MSTDYVPGTILRKVRAEISRVGGSEHLVAEGFGGMEDMFNQIQQLREEMNAAKRAAAEEAARPYLEAMQAVEKRYAMLLKLGASS